MLAAEWTISAASPHFNVHTNTISLIQTYLNQNGSTVDWHRRGPARVITRAVDLMYLRNGFFRATWAVMNIPV